MTNNALRKHISCDKMIVIFSILYANQHEECQLDEKLYKK